MSSNEIDEALIEKQILDLQMKLLESMAQMSYVTTEVVMLIPRKEENGDVISISLSYVTRGGDKLESTFTNDLASRLEATVGEWQAWVQSQVERKETTPF